LKVVSDRYRDRARLAIAVLDRHRAQKAAASLPDIVEAERPSAPTETGAPDDGTLRVGATVVYRPPGDRRAYPCQVKKIVGGRAYLVPHLTAWTGWVLIENLSLAPPDQTSDG
jgi:hypothetical protein